MSSLRTPPQRRVRRRPVLAVLTQYLDRSDGGYEYVLRRAFAAACRQHDFDLVVVCGEALEDPRADNAPKNRLYQMVDRRGIDGVILLTAGLASYCGVERLSKHIEHLRGLALCSLGTAIEGIPSVIADNRSGMTQLVEHVVLHHHRKHIAFLGALWGNEEIDSRRDATLSVCERFGVPIEPHRMIGAGLESVTAEAATTKLLEVDDGVDAIIAANDGSALGALRALEKRGARALARTIVTGYDDIPLAELLERPLSTVRQPLVELAETAVEVIWKQLNGLDFPFRVELPTQLVLRASCGCEWGAAGPVSGHWGPPDMSSTIRDSASGSGETGTATPLIDERQQATRSLHRRLSERIDVENMYVEILETANRLSRSLDLTDLEHNLTTYLPSIHSRDLFLDLFTNSSSTELRRAVANGERPDR